MLSHFAKRCVSGAGHIRQMTAIGDGAAWIGDIATRIFSEATQVVDLYHARERLHSLARSLEFMLLGRKYWTVAGADSIIALRRAEASSQWEAICRSRHDQTPAPDQPLNGDDLRPLQIVAQ